MRTRPEMHAAGPARASLRRCGWPRLGLCGLGAALWLAGLCALPLASTALWAQATAPASDVRPAPAASVPTALAQPRLEVPARPRLEVPARPRLEVPARPRLEVPARPQLELAAPASQAPRLQRPAHALPGARGEELAQRRAAPAAAGAAGPAPAAPLLAALREPILALAARRRAWREGDLSTLRRLSRELEEDLPAPAAAEAAIQLAWLLQPAGEAAPALSRLEAWLERAPQHPLAPFVALQAWPLWQALGHGRRGRSWGMRLEAAQPRSAWLGALLAWQAHSLLAAGQYGAAQQAVLRGQAAESALPVVQTRLLLLQARAAVRLGRSGWAVLKRGLVGEASWEEKEAALWEAGWGERGRVGHQAMLAGLRLAGERISPRSLAGLEQRARLSHFIEARFAAWRDPVAIERAIAAQIIHSASAGAPLSRAQSHVRQAELELLQRRPAAARQALQAALALQPGLRTSPATARQQALALVAEGAPGEALALLQRTLEQGLRQLEGLAQATLALPAAAGRQPAAALLRELLRLQLQTGRLLRSQGRCLEALPLLGGAAGRAEAQGASAHVADLARHPQADADVRERAAWNAGVCLSELGRWEEAAKVLRPLLSSAPLGAPAARLALTIQLRARQYAQMEVLLNRLLASKTLHYDGAVASWLGVAAAYQGRHRRAATHLQQAQALLPALAEHPAFQLRLGAALLALEDPAGEERLQAAAHSPVPQPVQRPANPTRLVPWQPAPPANRLARREAFLLLARQHLKASQPAKASAVLSQGLELLHAPAAQAALLALRRRAFLAAAAGKAKSSQRARWRRQAGADAALAAGMKRLEHQLGQLPAFPQAAPSAGVERGPALEAQASRALATQALELWRSGLKQARQAAGEQGAAAGSTSRKAAKEKGRKAAKEKGRKAAQRKSRKAAKHKDRGGLPAAGLVALQRGASTRLARQLQPAAFPAAAGAAVLDLHRSALAHLPPGEVRLRYRLTVRLDAWLKADPTTASERAALWRAVAPAALPPHLAQAVRLVQAETLLHEGSRLARQAARAQKQAAPPAPLGKKASARRKKQFKRASAQAKGHQARAARAAAAAASAYLEGLERLLGPQAEYFPSPHSPSPQAGAGAGRPALTEAQAALSLARQLAAALVALPPHPERLAQAARWQEWLLREVPQQERRALAEPLAWTQLQWALAAQQAGRAKSACLRARRALELTPAARWEAHAQAAQVWQWGLEQRCGRPALRKGRKPRKTPAWRRSPLHRPSAKADAAWHKTQWRLLLAAYEEALRQAHQGEERQALAFRVGLLFLEHTRETRKGRALLAQADLGGVEALSLRAGYTLAELRAKGKPAKSKQAAQAIKRLQALLSRKRVNRSPWSIPLHHLLASLHHRREEWRAALHHYRRAAKPQPKGPYAPFADFIGNAKAQARRIDIHLRLRGPQ